MRGHPDVLKELNAALSAELSAIVQYMVQSEMCENWGYERLHEVIRSRAMVEMRHAEGLIERILYLDGTPEVAVALQPEIGDNVKAQLEAGLKDEIASVRMYNDAIKVCERAADNGSRDLFQHMVENEEEHIDWIQAQLHDIEEMGMQNYLAQQLHKKE
jgi:bacterioferritin